MPLSFFTMPLIGAVDDEVVFLTNRWVLKRQYVSVNFGAKLNLILFDIISCFLKRDCKSYTIHRCEIKEKSQRFRHLLPSE